MGVVNKQQKLLTSYSLGHSCPCGGSGNLCCRWSANGGQAAEALDLIHLGTVPAHAGAVACLQTMECTSRAEGGCCWQTVVGPRHSTLTAPPLMCFVRMQVCHVAFASGMVSMAQ